ncbi:MAG: TPM domain-containing protein [Methylobacter sp.]|uniref:TPM domain-containing protein n=1 Tax=Methylobacter sp. TaxID=2051955 RepID=UPI002731F3BD|nr:TPM domain-containing protein [Methylobacter sp.]MDP1665926.1 TPM domain-containing protein [Methylobacter sp.]MDP1970258.1 TPM domain-containing protein [Methylobacter sp.]
MLSAIFPRVRYGLGFFLLLFCMVSWAIVGVPELSRRVTDLTTTLSAEQITKLENKLAAFEAKKGSQIAVLIVPTTQPKDISEFGIEVADLWQIGRKGVDDGVILIVAKDDRKLRLEVGYGLEGVIPDAVAKRVIAETITPHFKEGDYAGGIDAGVTQLMMLIEGEALPAPSENSGESLGEGSFMFVLIGGLIAGFALSAMMGRVMGGMLAGLGSGVVAALVLGLAFSAALFVGLMVFFIVGVRSTGGRGWSSGGGFGGSSGGGSWGGGGGRFGGGGASGSW